MGTELVCCGVKDVDKHKLWSALANVEFPDSVVQAHKNFINAGADIIITNTYQSNQPLLMSELKISREEADNLLLKTLDLAREAAGPGTIVAGSIGPYPDCPASEYNPEYLKRISFEELYEWHRPRFEILAKSSKVDILACETMPGIKEAQVILKLLSEVKKEAYISFACQKGTTNAGESFSDIVNMLKSEKPDNLRGIGINCSEPDVVEEFGTIMKANFPELTLICYPNTGEAWTNNAGEWEVESSQWGGTRADLASYVPRWLEVGFKWIGGCCRVEPKDIAKIANIVKNNTEQ